MFLCQVPVGLHELGPGLQEGKAAGGSVPSAAMRKELPKRLAASPPLVKCQDTKTNPVLSVVGRQAAFTTRETKLNKASLQSGKRRKHAELV